MIGSVILIALNALVWGVWSLGFATGGVNNTGQAVWYIYGPLAVLLSTTVAPAIALATGHLRQGARRSALRAALVITLFGFLPYACMSGGGV
jgi:hypothetical protein